ncbi:hypothetical protein MHAS44199_07450 [Mycolicibacterium hassiacum DSM 44199]|nr:hypothetical protein [Mycolicibacterium hassiacum DSM 44199]
MASANSGSADPTASTRRSSLAASSRAMRAAFCAYSASVDASRCRSARASSSVASASSSSRRFQNSSAVSGTSMPWAFSRSS